MNFTELVCGRAEKGTSQFEKPYLNACKRRTKCPGGRWQEVEGCPVKKEEELLQDHNVQDAYDNRKGNGSSLVQGPLQETCLAEARAVPRSDI